jgi:hypothetical protein
MLSLEQNEWSARTTVRTNLYVILNNKCGVRTNQKKGQTHVIIIDRTNITINRTTYYYNQNKFVCNLEQKSVRTNENNC